MRRGILIGLAFVGSMVASGAQVQAQVQPGSQAARHWYGTYRYDEDFGPDIDKHELISRHRLTVSARSCSYVDEHPHGLFKLSCTAMPQRRRLVVRFKSCPRDRGECSDPDLRHKTLFTLEQAGPELVTHWGALKQGTPDGVYFTR